MADELDYPEGDALKTELARETLVYEAKNQGRWVYVTTYLEGGTNPIKTSLLFRTASDAEECARVLNEAKRGSR